MKTKLLTMLLGGLAASLLTAVAQNTPAPDDKGQKPAAEAAAPAPAEPPAEILPLVQFEDAPLVDVIKTLARQAGVNVIFDPRVTQVDQTGKSTYPPVSIRLENVTAQNVLEAVLQNNSLRLDKDAKTKISRVTIKDPAAAEPLVVKVYQLKYAYPTNIVPTVKPTISTRGQVIPDVRTSQLIVLATEKELLEVDNLITKLDTPTKQVLIEARLLETTKNPSTAKGINWEGTFGNQNFTFGNNVVPQQTGGSSGQNNNQQTGDRAAAGVASSPLLSAAGPQLLVDTAKGFNPSTAFLDADGVRGVLSFFNKDNDSEVVATPRAVTADNVPATLSVTRALPIFKVTSAGTQTGPTVDITYTNIGIMLTVTPRISANNNIALKVVPEVSSVEETKSSQVLNGDLNTADIYAIRKIETQVLIPSGNTLVMGGLVSDDVKRGKTKVPILGDIPGLGYAFRSNSKARNKRNLIVFITPTVVEDNDFQPTPTKFLKNKPPVEDPADEHPEFKSALDSAEPHDWTKPVY
jgi:type II secretory pathway component GspD/PulD (secretin)